MGTTNKKATEAKTEVTFVTLLRRHRLSKGWTQAKLSQKLGLKSPSTVSFWESGESLPSPSMIPKLARLLSIDAMELTRVLDPVAPVLAK